MENYNYKDFCLILTFAKKFPCNGDQSGIIWNILKYSYNFLS